MTDPLGERRSGEACPACGAHELHLLYFPDLNATGARPYDDVFGFGDVKPDQPPGIGCAACGSEWSSVGEFRAAQTDKP